jgi:uncharacterized membrane protein YoaK (UPF0700 family)
MPSPMITDQPALRPPAAIVQERPPAGNNQTPHLNGYPVEVRKPVPQSERNRKRLAMCLSLTAGYLDGYGLLVLGTYVSFMSGNTTAAGVRTGQADLSLVVSPVIAIAAFLAGSFAGNVVAYSGLRHVHRVLFGLVAALLIMALQLQSDAVFKHVSIAALSFGMGMVNPAISRIGSEAVSLTFVTGTLSRIGNHLALGLRGVPVSGSQGPWDTHLYRARIGAQLWSAFIGGAALSGIVASFTSGLVLVPAIAMMLVLAVVSHPEISAP